MKFVNEEIIEYIAILGMVIFMFATIICVIVGNMQAAFICSIPFVICIMTGIAATNEYYEIIEYYESDWEELD